VSSRNAAQMRYDLVNDGGGINGRKIKFVVEDTQYQVPRGVAAVNKLINRDKVFAIVGGLGTPIINAAFKEQLAAGVPNLFPLTAARSMTDEPMKLKFALGASYYSQIRTGINYLWKEKQRKTLCVLYEDTDFGQEILEGAKDQAKVLNTEVKEAVGVKPTDTDFTAAMTKLKSANCDLVAMGTIIRTTIIPLGTAKRMGWSDPMFIGQTASYDYVVAAAPGGATEGFYSASGNFLPYADTATPAMQEWLKAYKEKFKADINAGSMYGWLGADLTVMALDRAGKNLTTDTFIAAIEGIKGYRDMFGGPTLAFSATNHQGANESYINVVQGGKWMPVSGQAMTH
jgi:branched-chain amino acid transport system substrate-binding protein